MARRGVTAGLWFLAVWEVVGTGTAVAGLPEVIGPVLAALTAAVIWWDPARALWKPAAEAALRRRRLADLERVVPGDASRDARREAEAARG